MSDFGIHLNDFVAFSSFFSCSVLCTKFLLYRSLRCFVCVTFCVHFILTPFDSYHITQCFRLTILLCPSKHSIEACIEICQRLNRFVEKFQLNQINCWNKNIYFCWFVWHSMIFDAWDSTSQKENYGTFMLRVLLVKSFWILVENSSLSSILGKMSACKHTDI